MLKVKLQQYETDIQRYEHLYQQNLSTFQSDIYKSKSPYKICRVNEIMHFVKVYADHHTKLFIHRIRYKESCVQVSTAASSLNHFTSEFCFEYLYHF